MAGSLHNYTVDLEVGLLDGRSVGAAVGWTLLGAAVGAAVG